MGTHRPLDWFLMTAAMMTMAFDVKATEGHPTKRMCSRIQLADTGTNRNPTIVVSWMCAVLNVKWKPQCRFQYSVTQTDSSVSISHTYISERPTYNPDGQSFDHSCNMTFPIAKLPPGTYKFHLILYLSQESQQYEVTDNLTLSTSGVNCDRPSLSYRNTAVTINCSMTSPYPQISCLLYRSKSDSQFQLATAKQYSESAKIRGQPYHFNTHCSMTQDIASLGAAPYRFRVEAIVSGEDEFILGKSNPSDVITFELPTAHFFDCPTGYIKGGSRIAPTCKCGLRSLGYPRGNPMWVLANNSRVDQLLKDDYSELTLRHRRDLQNQDYYCFGSSTLGVGKKVQYTPKFAYGPTSVLMTVQSDITRFSLCEGSPATFNVVCKVDKTSTNKKPTVTVTGSKMEPPRPVNKKSVGGDAFYYIFEYKIHPTVPGPLKIQCTAENPDFPELREVNSRTVTVLDPPKSNPKFAFNKNLLTNGATINVAVGQSYELTCYSEGGYPAESQATLKCSDFSKSGIVSSEKHLHLTMTVSKKDDGKVCWCDVSHESNCYHHKVQVELKVLYKPEIVYFIVDAQDHKYSNSIEVQAGETVEFRCAVKGNPKPSIAIRDRSSGEHLDQFAPQHRTTDVVHRAVKTTKCQDTGAYTCSIENSNGTPLERLVSVFVKCPPKSSPAQENNRNIIATPGGAIKVKVPISGYPIPYAYDLLKTTRATESFDDIGNAGHGETHAANDNDNSDGDDGDDDDDDDDDDGDDGDTNDEGTRRLRRETHVPVNGTDGRVKYKVNYVKDGPANGTVVVEMSGFSPEDSGHYLLVIKNGIGEGLQHSFAVIVKSNNAAGPNRPDNEENDNDSSGGIDGDNGHDSSLGVTSGAVVAAAVIVFVLVVVVVVVVVVAMRRKRKQAKRRKQERNRMCFYEEEDDDFVRITNEIYGLGGTGETNDEFDETNMYSQLNEDEIVSVRKDCSAAKESTAVYQNSTDQGEGQGQVRGQSNVDGNDLSTADGSSRRASREHDTDPDYVYV